VNQTYLGFDKKNKIEYSKRCLATEDRKKDVILQFFKCAITTFFLKKKKITRARKTEMILFHDLKFRELSCLLRPLVVCFFFYKYPVLLLLSVSNDVIKG
jgi:hypothetical protein